MPASVAQVQAHLHSVNQTLDQLNGEKFEVLHIEPTTDSINAGIAELRSQVSLEEFTTRARISELKAYARTGLKTDVATRLKTHIHDQARLAILAEVERAVADQVTDFIPISLQQQVDESRSQLEDVHRSLHNSEARRRNACLRDDNRDDKLAEVWTDSGEKSDIFPADLRSLWAYDDEDLERLLTEYGIQKLDTWEDNVNQFMAHIGVLSIHVMRTPSSPTASAI